MSEPTESAAHEAVEKTEHIEGSKEKRDEQEDLTPKEKKPDVKKYRTPKKQKHIPDGFDSYGSGVAPRVSFEWPKAEYVFKHSHPKRYFKYLVHPRHQAVFRYTDPLPVFQNYPDTEIEFFLRRLQFAVDNYGIPSNYEIKEFADFGFKFNVVDEEAPILQMSEYLDARTSETDYANAILQTYADEDRRVIKMNEYKADGGWIKIRQMKFRYRIKPDYEWDVTPHLGDHVYPRSSVAATVDVYTTLDHRPVFYPLSPTIDMRECYVLPMFDGEENVKVLAKIIPQSTKMMSRFFDFWYSVISGIYELRESDPTSTMYTITSILRTEVTRVNPLSDFGSSVTGEKTIVMFRKMVAALMMGGIVKFRYGPVFTSYDPRTLLGCFAYLFLVPRMLQHDGDVMICKDYILAMMNKLLVPREFIPTGGGRYFETRLPSWTGGLAAPAHFEPFTGWLQPGNYILGKGIESQMNVPINASFISSFFQYRMDSTVFPATLEERLRHVQRMLDFLTMLSKCQFDHAHRTYRSELAGIVLVLQSRGHELLEYMDMVNKQYDYFSALPMHAVFDGLGPLSYDIQVSTVSLFSFLVNITPGFFKVSEHIYDAHFFMLGLQRDLALLDWIYTTIYHHPTLKAYLTTKPVLHRVVRRAIDIIRPWFCTNEIFTWVDDYFETISSPANVTYHSEFNEALNKAFEVLEKLESYSLNGSSLFIMTNRFMAPPGMHYITAHDSLSETERANLTIVNRLDILKNRDLGDVVEEEFKWYTISLHEIQDHDDSSIRQQVYDVMQQVREFKNPEIKVYFMWDDYHSRYPLQVFTRQDCAPVWKMEYINPANLMDLSDTKDRIYYKLDEAKILSGVDVFRFSNTYRDI